MMIKCHRRDCQHVTGGPYAPAVVFPIAAFKLIKGGLRYHSQTAWPAVDTNAGSVPNAVAASREGNQKKGPHRS